MSLVNSIKTVLSAEGEEDERQNKTISYISTYYSQEMNILKGRLHENNMDVIKWNEINNAINKKQFLKYLESKNAVDICTQIYLNNREGVRSYNVGMLLLQNNDDYNQNNLKELKKLAFETINQVERKIIMEWLIDFIERRNEETKSHLCFVREVKGGFLQLQLFTIKINENQIEINQIFYGTVTCDIYIEDFLKMKLKDIDKNFTLRIRDPNANFLAAQQLYHDDMKCNIL